MIVARAVTVVLTVLALVGLQSAPASADPTFETVFSSAPEGWGSISGDCPDGGGTPNSFASPHYGPGNPLNGDGSLEMNAAVGQLSGTGSTFVNFSTLQTLQAVVWETAGSKFEFRIDVVTDSGYRTLIWAPNPADGQWALAQPNFASTSWNIHDTTTGALLGTTTLDAYQTAWPAKNWSPKVVSAGCAAASTVYLDALYVGAGATVDRIYNFEAQPTTVSMSATKSTLVFGQQVTLSSDATQMGFALPEGVGIDLWMKPAGKPWSKHSTILTNAEGRVSKTLTPKVTTEYQWRFPSYGANEPSKSTVKKVGVKAKVTIELLDDRLRRGDRMKAVGKATPNKQGVTATLWRQSATGNIKLGTATVRSDNTYRIVSSIITARGSATWKVFVTVPAEGGNLPGKSPLVSARIN